MWYSVECPGPFILYYDKGSINIALGQDCENTMVLQKLHGNGVER